MKPMKAEIEGREMISGLQSQLKKSKTGSKFLFDFDTNWDSNVE